MCRSSEGDGGRGQATSIGPCPLQAGRPVSGLCTWCPTLPHTRTLQHPKHARTRQQHDVLDAGAYAGEEGLQQRRKGGVSQNDAVLGVGNDVGCAMRSQEKTYRGEGGGLAQKQHHWSVATERYRPAIRRSRKGSIKEELQALEATAAHASARPPPHTTTRPQPRTEVVLKEARVECVAHSAQPHDAVPATPVGRGRRQARL